MSDRESKVPMLKGAASLICGVVLALFALAASPAKADVVEGIAAVVDGHLITRSELRQAIAGMKLPQNNEEVEHKVLEMLIERKLVELEAERLRVVPSDEEVDAAIANVRARSGLDGLAFRARVEKEGLRWDDYVAKVRVDIANARAFRAAMGPELQLNEESLREYYLKNAASFHSPGKVRLLHVSAKGEEGEAKLGELREALLAGEALEDAAQRLMGTAPSDTGLMDPAGLNETFRDAISDLGVGQPSLVISLGPTHMLLYLAERAEAKMIPFEEARDQVQELFMKTGEERYFRDWVEKLKEQAKIERKP